MQYELNDILAGSSPDYIDQEFALVDDVRNVDFATHGERLGSVLVLIFVSEGEMTLMVDGQPVVLTPHNVLFSAPGHRLGAATYTPHFCGHAMIASMRYAQRLITLTGNIWNYLLQLVANPVVELPPNLSEVLLTYYRLLLLEVNRKSNIYYHEIVTSIVRAMLCTMINDMRQSVRINALVAQQLELNPSNSPQALDLFNRFIDILTSERCTARKIEHYAQRLCVTPKYLSTVCVRLSNKSAHYWITMAIVNGIDHYLRYTTKSAKEIAMLYDFPNLAFFSKYVKKHLGKSPTQLRANSEE